MVNVYLSPRWFSGYDIVLEIIFALILLSISLFAFRIYNKTYQRSIKIFGISFSLMSLSYFIQSIFNLVMLSKADTNLPRGFYLRSIALINEYALIAHIILMTLGLITLSYMAMKKRNMIIPLFLSLISYLIIFLLPLNTLLLFYLLSSLYLIYLEAHFIRNYIRFKDMNSLMITVAFLSILTANIVFIFSLYHKIFYFFGHLFLLLSFLLILLNFYIIRKNVKEKRKA